MTPMMTQYLEMKEKYPDTILFFRLGDFYEMFFEDAKTAAKELELVLTSRNKEAGVPMCGVPYHAVDGYLAKLVSKGYKVAICEQLSDPKEKGIVDRDVIRVVTPGTVTTDRLLDEKDNNFLAAVCQCEASFGIGFIDITTGTMLVTQADSRDALMNELARYTAKEILLGGEIGQDEKMAGLIRERFDACVDFYPNVPSWEDSLAAVQRQFHTDSFQTLGVPDSVHVVCAVGMLLDYVSLTQKAVLPQIRSVDYYVSDEFMNMDLFTRRNLELTETMRKKSKTGSLLWVLDHTKTSMGGRKLRAWIEKPLVNYIKIQNRLHAVSELVEKPQARADFTECLAGIYDMERIISRVVSGTATCRDLVSLKQSLGQLPDLEMRLYQLKSGLMQDACRKMDSMAELHKLLEEAIDDNPPITLKDGGLIKRGYDKDVDEYNDLMKNGHAMLAEMEEREKKRTGIKTLKIRHNKVFGYYIEVSKGSVDQVPDDFIRKQTLVNGERYITPELKDLESRILTAEERVCSREYELYCEVRDKVSEAVERIQKTADVVALVDCICSLAETAARNRYCMPVVDTSDKIEITEGRHPVVEQMLSDGLFVPNDSHMDLADNRLLVITGPNMAGKSTYMRQVAIIVLMAQIGSFVPAATCHIGVVDKIFTRVGASDDLTAGQSTFMVEMTEVANILKNATNRSLIVFDEIGRGTSTFDGLAIAWSVVEHSADIRKLGARTLFATHYHELTELESRLDGVKNYCTSVKKRGDEITFLRRITPGGADNSYGIEVAALAGVPNPVIRRAKEILKVLEQNDLNKPEAKGRQAKTPKEDAQPDLMCAAQNEISEAIRALDLSTFTPIEALNKLYELQKML